MSSSHTSLPSASRQRCTAWRTRRPGLYWLYWLLPVAVSGGRWLPVVPRAGSAGRASLPRVAGLSLLTLLVNSGFLRDPLSAPPGGLRLSLRLCLAHGSLGVAWTRRWRDAELADGRVPFRWPCLFDHDRCGRTIAALPERIDYTGVREGMQGLRARAAAVRQLLASSHRQTLAPPSRVSAALMPFFNYLDRCTSLR